MLNQMMSTILLLTNSEEYCDPPKYTDKFLIFIYYAVFVKTKQNKTSRFSMVTEIFIQHFEGRDVSKKSNFNFFIQKMKTKV